MRFATLVDKKKNVVSMMNRLENCQARYRSNTWMGRTRTDGPNEFEPSKFDCSAGKKRRAYSTYSYEDIVQVTRVGLITLIVMKT